MCGDSVKEVSTLFNLFATVDQCFSYLLLYFFLKKERFNPRESSRPGILLKDPCPPPACGALGG